MIKLREILKIPDFKGFEIVAGRGGLDRDISTVSVMDAPDIYKWMKGGEFLITSAYVVKDNTGYIKYLIENLDKWGASALGVKFDRFIHELPADAIAIAERLNFPIVSIPIEFAFTDVINPVLREIIDSQSRRMLYAENIHSSFTKMVLEDKAISFILSFLEQHIHSEVAFWDVCFSRVYFADNNNRTSNFAKEVIGDDTKYCRLPEALLGYKHYQLHINEDQYGYILIGDVWESYDLSFEDYYRIAIEQAGTVLILKTQKQLARAQIESNYREQFVQDLLRANFKSKEEIINRAKVFNWNLLAGGIVVIVDIDHFKKQYLNQLDKERNTMIEKTMSHILNISKRIVGREYKNYIYSRFSDRIAFIISDNVGNKAYYQEKMKSVFDEVRRELKKAVSFTATVGIGGHKGDIGDISVSWEEAEKAVNISRNMLREDVVIFYEELGVYKLLSLVSASKEAEEFEQVYLKRLKEYDRNSGTELLETICKLTACGWNLKEASQKLYIHYNSMKYRYRKISEILGLDLACPEERLNLELAIKLHQIKEIV